MKEADEAMIQLWGARVGTEAVRSTKVEATQEMRAVTVDSTLETWAGSLADLSELGVWANDARAAGKR